MCAEASRANFLVGGDPPEADTKLGQSCKAGLRDASIGTGIAVDKMLALTGQAPALQIANIVMPSEEERAERRAIDDKLDAIARRLMEAKSA